MPGSPSSSSSTELQVGLPAPSTPPPTLYCLYQRYQRYQRKALEHSLSSIIACCQVGSLSFVGFHVLHNLAVSVGVAQRLCSISQVLGPTPCKNVCVCLRLLVRWSLFGLIISPYIEVNAFLSQHTIQERKECMGGQLLAFGCPYSLHFFRESRVLLLISVTTTSNTTRKSPKGARLGEHGHDIDRAPRTL